VTSKDMTLAQFNAALVKHGIGLMNGIGYYDVGRGSHVYGANAGLNRRAQLAYLLKAQRDNEERHARIDAAVAERDALIGGKQDNERVGITHDGINFELRLEKLTVKECAAVVLALREARKP